MNRRKMLALLGASPALVAGTPSYAGAAPKTAPKSAAPMATGLLTSLNPAVTPKLAEQKPLAPRLDTLDGKTIYLVDTDWGGMGQNDGILQDMQAWFAEHMPTSRRSSK